MNFSILFACSSMINADSDYCELTCHRITSNVIINDSKVESGKRFSDFW